MKLKRKLLRHGSNTIGWRTDRKILVLESDDWGSIRVPSKEVYKDFVSSGISLNQHYFTKYDALESNTDVDQLFDLLTHFKDLNGNHPILTGLFIMANPNFEKIAKSDCKEYFYEPFTETLKRYPEHDKVLDLYKSGISENLFLPQFHGREHLNVHLWLKGLNNKWDVTVRAFKNNFTGVPNFIANEKRRDYQAAFDIENRNEIEFLESVLDDGIDLFKRIFGFQPTYFVPTNGPYNFQLNHKLVKNGIKYLNVAKIRREPIGRGKNKMYLHYQGQRLKQNLTCITRNVVFEPSKPEKESWIDDALFEISSAFKWKKPAVISTHRVNYVGFLDKKNQMRGLDQLKILLGEITKKWPDVEFMSSHQLGDTIEKSRSEYR